MCCKGKCYISKQINQSSDAQTPNTPNNESSIPDFEVSSICKIGTPNILSQVMIGNYKNSYTSLYMSENLRPPCMI